MPKLNLNVNGTDVGAAEGYEAWKQEDLPPTGSYNGKLKVVQVDKAGPKAKNPGATMLKVGVELVDPGKPWHGFVAFRNLVLIDSTLPYVNQFLMAITDGSDAAFEKIKRSFYDAGPIVDEREKNIIKIGTYKINSPEGELPIKVAIKQRPYEGQLQSGIQAFLLRDDAASTPGGSAAADDEPVAEEDDSDEPVGGEVFDMDAEEEVPAG